MMTKHKANPLVEPIQFSERLRAKRLERGLTLKQVEKSVGIAAGQISRFERGAFKMISKNLQNYACFLQIDFSNSFESSIQDRILAIASKSTKHRKALEEIIAALERIT